MSEPLLLLLQVWRPGRGVASPLPFKMCRLGKEVGRGGRSCAIRAVGTKREGTERSGGPAPASAQGVGRPRGGRAAPTGGWVNDKVMSGLAGLDLCLRGKLQASRQASRC